MEETTEYKNLSYYEKKLEYAVGVLEIVSVLMNTNDESLKKENLSHLNRILPKAIEELKTKP